MPRFKVDENLPAGVALILNQAGQDALSAIDQQLAGCADATLAAICRQEARAIITLDLDSSDIRAYPPGDYSGIIVLRLSRLDKHHLLAALQRFLPLLDREPLAGRLWIVDETTVRIRG